MSRSKYSYFLFFLGLSLTMHAQWQRGMLSSDLRVLPMMCDPADVRAKNKRSDISLMQGFPMNFAADPSFKNFRNVSLEDLDGLQGQEIVVGIGNKLVVLTAEGIMWSHMLSGIVRFPPSIGDLDQDGILDIVVLTGYSQGPGFIYCFNAFGQSRAGWPKSVDGNTLVSAAALADMDGNEQLEILFGDISDGRGSLYVLREDGTNFSGWPVLLPNVPAVTPSVGDLNSDGQVEVVINTTREMYLFSATGQLQRGWPVGNGLTKYSFQSPILADLTKNQQLEIIGAGHGDQPQFYVIDHEGIYLPNWPIPVPGQSWTFQPPTVVTYLDDLLILTGRPIGTQPEDMLYAYKIDGSLANGFPIVKPGGLEGLITVGDIDGDEEPEMLFPSNLIDAKGNGFIHAYEFDGSGELPNFPITVYGWTYLNGATLGDIDGDDLLDMVVLSYTEHLDATPDTTFINVFEMNVPLHRSSLLWPTYKGNNLHNGVVDLTLSTSDLYLQPGLLRIFPNPASTFLLVNSERDALLRLYDLRGTLVNETAIRSGIPTNIEIDNLGTGIYHAVFRTDNQLSVSQKLVVIQD